MKTRTALLVAIIAALGASACRRRAPSVAPPSAAPFVNDATLAAKIDPIVADLLAKTPAAGISVAIARDDALVFAKGYGLADRARGIAATADTIYRIGSVTKQFTAAAIMQLVEQGKLGLDDAITKHLPEYPVPAGATITVRHLLTHTSGIHNYTDEQFLATAAQAVTVPQLIAKFSDRPLDFAPGARWSYSNSGYVLLGAIVERVSGQPYADYLRQHLWTPLGLTGTRYCDDEPTLPNDAAGYATSEGQLVPSAPISMTTPYAAGAICSTVGDLVRWTTALHDHVVVSEASYLQMTTPATLATGTPAPYGFGLGIGALDGHMMISHGGGINGFVSSVAYFPQDRVTVVVLVNTAGPAAATGAKRIARAVLDIPEPRVDDQPLPGDAATRYPGVYAFPALGDFELTVTVEDGQVMAQATRQPRLAYVHQGNDVFLARDHLEIKFTFHIGPDGRADTLTIDQNGAHLIGDRVP